MPSEWLLRRPSQGPPAPDSDRGLDGVVRKRIVRKRRPQGTRGGVGLLALFAVGHLNDFPCGWCCCNSARGRDRSCEQSRYRGRLHWQRCAECLFHFVEHSRSQLLHHMALPLRTDAMSSEQRSPGVVHEESSDLRLATALWFSRRRHTQVALTQLTRRATVQFIRTTMNLAMGVDSILLPGRTGQA